jgi:hypothetical protein
MLSLVMLSLVMLSVVMLSVVMLSVVMLSVIMLIVVAPRSIAWKILQPSSTTQKITEIFTQLGRIPQIIIHA